MTLQDLMDRARDVLEDVERKLYDLSIAEAKVRTLQAKVTELQATLDGLQLCVVTSNRSPATMATIIQIEVSLETIATVGNMPELRRMLADRAYRMILALGSPRLAVET